RTFVRGDAPDRRDLPVEPALVDGPDRARVALQRVLLKLGSLDAPLLAHQLRAAELRDLLVSVPVLPALAKRQRHAFLMRQRDRAPHRDHAHALDAGCNHEILSAGEYTLRGEVNCLLRRAALPVDSHSGHVLRESGRQPGVPGDVDGLWANLR